MMREVAVKKDGTGAGYFTRTRYSVILDKLAPVADPVELESIFESSRIRWMNDEEQ